MSIDWDAIKAAYQLIVSKTVNKVEGNCWKVYRVANTIRIDIDD